MPSKFSWDIWRAREIALALFVTTLAASAQEPAQSPPIGQPPFREGRILVIPRAGRADAIRTLHGQSQARILRTFPRLGNIHVLELPAGVSSPDLAQRYRQSGLFEAVALNHLFQPAAIPNDPRFLSGEQWTHNNTGQNNGLFDADIDAVEAWDTLNSASNIIVAVADSGVRQTHQDLAANLWRNPGEIPGNGLDDDGNGFVDDVHGINLIGPVNTGSPEDDTGHGSHVAGILGAVGNNGVGVAGVAWRVQIMPLRFLNHQEGSLADLITCLDYARANGAKVINCSFVSPTFDGINILEDAFKAARDAGIVVVAAAGNANANNDVNPQYPASFQLDNVISVMATSRTDERWFFSNYGATNVDLAAPGVDILSTYIGSDSAYTAINGTSMASPCVAGAVALLWARFPSFNYRQIVQRVLNSVDPLPNLAGQCVTGGRLNLKRALGEGDFTVQAAPFGWVTTNGMTPMTLSGDGVSAAVPLPFSFRFYGRDYSQIYVGANGLIGFTNAGLGLAINEDLPSINAPNAALYPYWDDLNPAVGGSIWTGFFGIAPNRKMVVSWVDVPHWVTTQGPTLYTFQAILHETLQVAFQYSKVQTGRSTLISGKSATIGVEDGDGIMATRYSFNPSAGSVTNNQAIVFIPQGALNIGPSMRVETGPQAGQRTLRLFGQPARRCVISASSDLVNWTALSTNTLPASGTISVTDTTAGTETRRFYQALLDP